jgi:hypothetical protein
MTFEDIARHVGHDIEVAFYGRVDYLPGTIPAPANAANAAVECLTCGEILVSADRPAAAESR